MKEFWINKTQEECAEVIQALCKWRNYGPSLRHPVTQVSNKELLEEEIGDLQYCLEQLIESLDLNQHHIDLALLRKERKIHDFIGYSALTDTTAADMKQSMRLQKHNDEDFDMDGRC